MPTAVRARPTPTREAGEVGVLAARGVGARQAGWARGRKAGGQLLLRRLTPTLRPVPTTVMR